MKASHMAVVVPMDALPQDREKARQEVWGTVTSLLLPALGKLYGRFYPAVQAWGNRIGRPYGVILGSEAPEQFLLLYLAGRRAQADAIAYHTDALLKTVDPKQLAMIEETLLCPVVVDGRDNEQTAHAVWHIALHKGALLPDCGMYYTALGRALIGRKEEQMILDDPARYALCVVTLEKLEAQNG